MKKLLLLCLTILGLLLTASTVTSKAISLTDAAPAYAKASLKSGQVTRPLTKSAVYGGDGGTQFDDIAELGSTNIYGRVHSINISSGDLVDSIEIFYVLKNKSIQGIRHGKPSNPPVNIVLHPQEEIVKIEGRIYNNWVGQLTITTIGPSYVTKTYGPFGKIGQLSFEFQGQIIGFHGRSGDNLDQIGVYKLEKLTKSDEYGSTSAAPFDDISDLGYPPIVSLKSINVWSRPETILAIQADYLLLDGSTLKGGRHGFLYTDNVTTIGLEAGDQVISMDGMIATSTELNQNKFISQLTFTVAKENGSILKYGPFGKWGSEAFSVRGNIIGMYGESGSNLYKIGAYYISL